ncbi:hypothetical protein [Paenibacillus sp. PL2-23]|uniref:hypothetical protein n=1 Tax=Paenibacillus sp. PL2-23 TaxID=2100729 RepID=UPI0030F577DE
MNQRTGLRRKKRIWRVLWIGLLGSAALLSGCGQDAGGKVESYGNDGYLGYTNTNPNLLNRSGTLYHRDMDMINQLLRPMSGVKTAEAGFNGDVLNVKLRVSDNATDKERDSIRAEAQALLQANFPRYDVHVKVAD